MRVREITVQSYNRTVSVLRILYVYVYGSTFVRKYESTFESTFVLKYESTLKYERVMKVRCRATVHVHVLPKQQNMKQLLLYESTTYESTKVRKYESTFEDTRTCTRTVEYY